MLQNKCLKQTMYASYINLQPLAVSRMEASRPSTGLPLMALVRFSVHIYISCYEAASCEMVAGWIVQQLQQRLETGVPKLNLSFL